MEVAQSLHVPALPALLFQFGLLMSFQKHAVTEILKQIQFTLINCYFKPFVVIIKTY